MGKKYVEVKKKLKVGYFTSGNELIEPSERLEGSKSKMTAKTKQIITEWLWGDFKLYHHFKRKLNQKIQKFGPNRIRNQIQHLQKLNQELHTNCHGAYANNTDLKGVA